jgi:hypothetical protein
MTVRAQQLKVASVSGPILEASRPDVLPILRADLFGRVYVVNVERPVIVKTAS